MSKVSSLIRHAAALIALAVTALVLAAVPAGAHPGHGSAPGHVHDSPVGSWLALIAAVAVVAAVGVLVVRHAMRDDDVER